MKTLATTIALLVLLSGSPLTALTLEEVIAKHIEHCGGMEKLASLETGKSYGRQMMMGMEFPFVTYQKNPSKIRIEFSYQGINGIMAYDGETAWALSPLMGYTEPQELPANQALGLKLMAYIEGPLVNYEEKGYKVEYLGLEDLEGTDVHHVHVILSDTLSMDMYLDAEHFLDVKWTSNITLEGVEYQQHTFFGDYKEVDGMPIAHSLESFDGQQQTSQIIIDSMFFNVEVPDSIFVMPAVAEKPDSDSAEGGR
jgi:outer membrane lipoprotein-sorting protein